MSKIKIFQYEEPDLVHLERNLKHETLMHSDEGEIKMELGDVVELTHNGEVHGRYLVTKKEPIKFSEKFSYKYFLTKIGNG